MSTFRLTNGDALESLRSLPDESVNCVVTSPPYFGLRDYGTGRWEGGDSECRHLVRNDPRVSVSTLAGGKATTGHQREGSRDRCPRCGAMRADSQIGLERTPDEYVARLVAVFREVRRVLRSDGALFLNLGDSYAGGVPRHGDKNLGKSGTNKRRAGAVDRNMFPQRLRLRYDVSDEQKREVALAMFGMRLEGNEEACQGSLPEVLSVSGQSEALFRRPAMEGEGIASIIPTEQSESIRADGETTEGSEDRSSGGSRGQVRLLRGDRNRVSDCRSHQEQRRSAPEGTVRQLPCEFSQDIQGDTTSRIPQARVPSALLQLQLLHRVLGILSTHSFADDEVPDPVKAYFRPEVGTLKPKDLIGIPWRAALALQADGWWLRSDIIWAKPNPMPESVTDRCTRSHEYIFMLTKSERYWYNAAAIAEEAAKGAAGSRFDIGKTALHQLGRSSHIERRDRDTRNRRTVWTVATQPFADAHFATFPEKLIEPCILAGCPSGGVVLDPFCGSGTVGVVALRHGRDFVGIELNAEYVEMARRRITRDAPLLNSEDGRLSA